MNKIILIIAAVFCVVLAQAQTNPPAAAAPTNAPATNAAPQQMVITSVSGEVDMEARKLVYLGNVVVSQEGMKLTCDRLLADIPEKGKRIDHIEAQTNVVVHCLDERNQPVTITGHLAVYRFGIQAGITNEVITLTGSLTNSPVVESADFVTKGDSIRWTRVNGESKGKISVDNQRIIIKSTPGTNAVPLKLF